MEQETTEDDEKTAESPQPVVGSLGDDVVPKRSTTATSAAGTFPTDSKPTMGGGTARKRGRPRKNVAEATATTTTTTTKPVEKPSVAVDALFFAGLNGTLKLMVQQERQHKLSRLAIV